MTRPVGPPWRYYGGKWRASRLYEPPRHGLIIEPFAGAAGYACHYHTRDVLLVDANPQVVTAWQWLIDATRSDVMALPPSLEYGVPVESLGLPVGATMLLRWWCNDGAATACRSPSKWAAANGWNTATRQRTAALAEAVSHWSVMLGTYRDAPDVEASWFVDPPYQGCAGSHYKVGSDTIDYDDLASWCLSREGDVTVCEGPRADWLPFRPFATIKASESKTGGKRSVERVWTNYEPAQASLFSAGLPGGG